jgi:hypothetical protein
MQISEKPAAASPSSVSGAPQKDAPQKPAATAASDGARQSLTEFFGALKDTANKKRAEQLRAETKGKLSRYAKTLADAKAIGMSSTEIAAELIERTEEFKGYDRAAVAAGIDEIIKAQNKKGANGEGDA